MIAVELACGKLTANTFQRLKDSDTLIEIHNVSKSFYALKAIDDVSLTIPAGEVVGLLGPNGAGKTTLFRLIAGLIQPDNGRIAPIAGQRWPTIGYKPDRLLFPNHLRISEYLEIVAGLTNVPPNSVKRVVFDSLAQVDLIYAANKKIGELSKGMRQRLGVAQVLVGEPSLLLLDEPSNGLDPVGQADMSRRIQELHAAGKTILISSHQLQEITQACTYLVILNHGKVLYQNRTDEALALRSHTLIQVDRDFSTMHSVIRALHEEITIQDNAVLLRGEAMALRRDIMTMLLSAGYDIIHVEEKRKTLTEIYAEALQ